MQLIGGSERSVRLESIYTDVTGITGQPLNDSYHFGQTIINNYGRPYQEGFNTYDGFSGYGTAGRFTLYARGEYQYAPVGCRLPAIGSSGNRDSRRQPTAAGDSCCRPPINSPFLTRMSLPMRADGIWPLENRVSGGGREMADLCSSATTRRRSTCFVQVRSHPLRFHLSHGFLDP